MNNKKYENISKLPADKRYAKFISDVANLESIWLLRDVNGFYLLQSGSGQYIMPVWSEKDIVVTYRELNDLQECTVVNISLDEFIGEWIGFANDNNLSFSPLPFGKGMLVAPNKIMEDLLDEYETM